VELTQAKIGAGNPPYKVIPQIASFLPTIHFLILLDQPKSLRSGKALTGASPLNLARMSWGARKSHQRRCNDYLYLKFSRDGYLDIVLGKIAAATARASWWRTRFADHQFSCVQMRAAQILSSPDTSVQSAFLAARQ
jgi:hypothetical protein